MANTKTMYDIYGNILSPGYCEVHPYIYEEYPCHLCMHELEEQEKYDCDAYEVEAYGDYFEGLMEDYYKQRLVQHPLTKQKGLKCLVCGNTTYIGEDINIGFCGYCKQSGVHLDMEYALLSNIG